jgi:hypothetical protein
MHIIIKSNLKEFKSKAETALWVVESYDLVPQYLKLESTDGVCFRIYMILDVPDNFAF